MTLPIIQTGHPTLRQRARELSIEEIRSPEIQDLIEQMRETMHEAPGVGLAAPQIDRGIRLVVIEDPAELMAKQSKQGLAERERSPVDFHVLINPLLETVGGETVEHYEGCLSIDGYTALTVRHRHVRVTALNEKGEEFTREAIGWYARILQHEIDHLNGALYIDRMNVRSFSTVKNKEQYWNVPPHEAITKLNSWHVS